MNLDSSEARRQHLRFGKLGDLLFDRDEEESELLFDLGTRDRVTREKMMFDRRNNEWVPYDSGRVPYTYSLAPAPQTVAEELDYFVRSAPLIKHKFIWAKDQLSFDQFAKLNSRRNAEMIGRFTIVPELPSVDNLGRMVKGFLEQNQDDFIALN